MEIQWPKVLPHDDGIRPAGPSDECFYCHRKVGEEHKRTCVVIEKKVQITVTLKLDLTVDVPHHWDREQIEFKYNGSTWCASNMIESIKTELDRIDSEACLCQFFEAYYNGIIDDTPIQSPERLPGEPVK